MEQGRLYRTGELYIYAEETREGGLRLLRCYGGMPLAELPDTVDGLAVTEIGDYCFADSPRACRPAQALPDGVRELAGDYIRYAVLPDCVKKLGDFAFYNCSSLEEIFFGAGLEAVGSDVFMNCPGLRAWNVRSAMDGRTGLKQLLAQRMLATTVFFRQGGEVTGEVFFPEYYEYHDEIGPAHIFALNIQGEGFRARQCFEDGVFSPHSYDEIFGQACAQEDEETLCRMAFGRICFPVSLSGEARERYYAYLREHEDALARLLVGERDVERLVYAARNEVFSGRGLQYAVQLAAQHGWTEGTAGLLSAQGKAGGTELDAYSFEDF